MTEQQKKQKEIAEAFIKFWWENNLPLAGLFEAWLLTEEGKRLTAEESGNEEEVKWLRAAMETQYEAYEALAKETAQDIKGLKQQLDRIEGNMKLTKDDETLWDEQQIRNKTRKE